MGKGMLKGYTLGTQEVLLQCVKCKRNFVIRTNNLELYTPEVRAAYICLICRPHGVKSSVSSAKKPEQVAVPAKTAGANTESKITKDQVKDILTKLPVPDRWKKELQARVCLGTSSRSELLLELNGIIDIKTRVREGSVEERREEVRCKCLKVIDKILV